MSVTSICAVLLLTYVVWILCAYINALLYVIWPKWWMFSLTYLTQKIMGSTTTLCACQSELPCITNIKAFNLNVLDEFFWFKNRMQIITRTRFNYFQLNWARMMLLHCHDMMPGCPSASLYIVLMHLSHIAYSGRVRSLFYVATYGTESDLIKRWVRGDKIQLNTSSMLLHLTFFCVAFGRVFYWLDFSEIARLSLHLFGSGINCSN